MHFFKFIPNVTGSKTCLSIAKILVFTMRQNYFCTREVIKAQATTTDRLGSISVSRPAISPHEITLVCMVSCAYIGSPGI